MRRKWVCLFLSVGMITLSIVTAKALEPAGTLQILPLWCGTPVSGGEIILYWIGAETPEGIQVTDGLANWIFQEGEVLQEEWLQWVLEKNGGNVRIEKVRDDCGAFFQDLKKGVYLVRQEQPAEGFLKLEPFLVQLPEGVQWDLVKMPAVCSMGEAPHTGDHPAPIIGAMGIGFSVAVLMVLVDSHKK